MSADDDWLRNVRLKDAACIDAEILRQSIMSLRLEQAQLVADCERFIEIAKRLHERATRLLASVHVLRAKIDQAERELGRLGHP